MIANLKSLTPSFEKGKQLLTVEIGCDYREPFDQLKGKEVTVEIKRYHPKRSLNANSYAWVLINKIANAAQSTEDEIYLQCLKDYGQSQLCAVKSEVNVSGYFRYYDELEQTTVKGNKFTWYRVYKGSSEMDSAEMAKLIDGIVSEAKELGIETMTPNELFRLKEAWGEI